MEPPEESYYIFDNYEHKNSDVFYCVTRIPGKGVPESRFQFIESGCSCPNSECTVENNCTCLRYGRNYERTSYGLLLEKDKFGNVPIFECNWKCSCFEDVKKISGKTNLKRLSCSCPNRNVQFGPIDCLEVFEAGAKGLGLKTKRKIPSGGFICEYAGEVIGLEEARNRQRGLNLMNFVFVLKEYAGEVLSNVTCVDPSHVGNIGRYINHSCQPNAAVVPIRVNDTIPWLCVFALKDINEGEEICYDYSGCGVDSVPGSGNKPCLCGAFTCRQYLPFEVII